MVEIAVEIDAAAVAVAEIGAVVVVEEIDGGGGGGGGRRP